MAIRQDEFWVEYGAQARTLAPSQIVLSHNQDSASISLVLYYSRKTNFTF